jgi:hypothetical protein
LKIDNLSDVLKPPKADLARFCPRCERIGTIVGLELFCTNLFVHRKCSTSECENNFDVNNGKQWAEIKPYGDYSSDELREILDWMDDNPVSFMFEGKKEVLGWDTKVLHELTESDKKKGKNLPDFISNGEYASMRIREILDAADARAGKLSEAYKRYHQQK